MSCVTCDPKSRIRTVWWDIRKCAECGECRDAGMSNILRSRSRYYSEVSGTPDHNISRSFGHSPHCLGHVRPWRRPRVPRPDGSPGAPAAGRARRPRRPPRRQLGSGRPPCRSSRCGFAGRPNWTRHRRQASRPTIVRVFVPLATGGLIAVSVDNGAVVLAIRRGDDGPSSGGRRSRLRGRRRRPARPRRRLRPDRVARRR